MEFYHADSARCRVVLNGSRLSNERLSSRAIVFCIQSGRANVFIFKQITFVIYTYDDEHYIIP